MLETSSITVDSNRLNLSGLHLASVISFWPRQSANCCSTVVPEHSGFNQTCCCFQLSSSCLIAAAWRYFEVFQKERSFTCYCPISTPIGTKSHWAHRCCMSKSNIVLLRFFSIHTARVNYGNSKLCINKSDDRILHYSVTTVSRYVIGGCTYR